MSIFFSDCAAEFRLETDVLKIVYVWQLSARKALFANQGSSLHTTVIYTIVLDTVEIFWYLYDQCKPQLAEYVIYILLGIRGDSTLLNSKTFCG